MNKWFLLLLILVFSQCKNPTNNTDKDVKANAAKELVNNLAEQVAKKPDSVGLRFKYVSALDSIGDYKKALSQIDSLIVYDKGNYGLWFKKSQICEHAGDTASAITYYTTATTIYPAPTALLALANLYAETKNVKALNICQQIDEMRLGNEYDAYTAFFAGVFFSRTGNKEKALLFFDKSIANNYTFMDAYLEKGYVYYDLKKFTNALDVFKTAAEVSNRFADAYYWQGKCLEALNKKSDAINKYQQALALNNTLQEADAALKRLQ